MNLNKQQVKALLDIISKDETRDGLLRASIQEYKEKKYLVATDTYKLVALRISDEMPVGAYVRREDLVKWYKLADRKSYLTEDDLTFKDEMLQVADEKFPKWQAIIDGLEPEPQGAIAFQAAYIQPHEIIAQSSGLAWNFHGKYSAMIAYNNGDMHVVMPLRV